MTEPIATLLRTRAILDRYGLRPRKGFGQNFLVDPSVPRAIVADAGVGPEDAVLEIGPGIGSMTQFLAETAKTVVAVELDKGLLPVLADTLMEYRNVHVVQGDTHKQQNSPIAVFFDGALLFLRLPLDPQGQLF